MHNINWKIKRDGGEYILLSDINSSEFREMSSTNNPDSELSKEKCDELFKDEESDEIFVTHTREKNQCDGCNAGHDMNDLGMHVYPNSTRAYMVCQKNLYNSVFRKIPN